MEEKIYLIKAFTAWTFADQFEDLNTWDDSLKNSEIVQQIIRSKPIHIFKDEGEAHLGKDIDHENDDCAADLPAENFEDIGDEEDKVWMMTWRLDNHHGKDHLKEDSLMHSNNKPFECDDCGISFSQKNNLKRHSWTHSNVKPFECGHCGKSFSQKSELKRHSHIHTKDKPFKCEYCRRSFSQKIHLKVHMPTHTGEKMYSCQACGKSFARLCSRNRHSSRSCRSTTGDCVVSWVPQSMEENS